MWTPQHNQTVHLGKWSAVASAGCFHVKGHQFVPATLGVFNAKMVSQILYGILVWISGFNHQLEQIQAMFWRHILHFPESGQIYLGTKAWISNCMFWLPLPFRVAPGSCCVFLTLSDSFLSSWASGILRDL